MRKDDGKDFADCVVTGLDEYKVAIDGKESAVPWVAKNCATRLDMFRWKLGKCAVDSEAASKLRGSCVHYARVQSAALRTFRAQGVPLEVFVRAGQTE